VVARTSPEGPVFLVSDLCSMLEGYLEPIQVAEVYRAYLFGAEAHEGQHRLTGEPYIYHPLAVARIMAEMRIDHKSIMAAILHDVIEDTPTAKEQLVAEFDEEVAELVDGVSKLTHIEFESKAEAQAENFRKMMLAMVWDLRIILIKLADRLHNMRTLAIMRPDKRRRIARETLEIYAPIANRMGINSIRLELEELGFAAYYPVRYRVLEAAVKKARGHRKEVVEKTQAAIQERLTQEDLEGRVLGREKHLYSIYRKMRSKHLSFNEVMDVFAFRIIVGSVDGCYRVLGAVHNLYKPIPGKFKDYIAIPKANGYQSLHTTLQSPYGFPIEVQIRTRDMETVARAGIAAHWLYKDGERVGRSNSNIAHARARQWLSNLLELQKSAGDSVEFLEHVKVDLFPDEVYVFTPNGEIRELPRGATVVDYAYSVHSDLGNSCVAAKVDDRLVPLNTRLSSGQKVEIITSPSAYPNPAWLNFVVTGKARAAVRHYLKTMRRDESVRLGRRLLSKALGGDSSSLESVPQQRLTRVLEEHGYHSLDDVLEDIGLGNRMATLVAAALRSDEHEMPAASPSEPLMIKGTEGTVVSFGKCCHPIPGDPILGFVSAGRGVVIHTRNCKNVASYRKHPEKWIQVQWQEGAEGEFPVELRLEVANQRGVLATVAASIAETNSNIDNIALEERDGIHPALDITVEVRDRRHLAQIMRRLRQIEQVLRISRLQR